MLTIGEFARQGDISARMLRHYNAIGLLRPAHIAPNGYRMYDEAQLPILLQIETLKSYGFPLAEIGVLLALPPDGLSQRIYARRLQLFAELNDLRRKIRRMESAMIQMEETEMTKGKYHVIVMDAPEQRVFGIRRTINIAETHALFQELQREMEIRGLRRVGATQQRCYSEDFNYEAMDVEAQAVVADDAAGDGVSTIPSGAFATVTHVGPYEELHFAYEALGQWLSAHPEYAVCGPAIERYLKDEATVQNPEELETGVLFPVQKS